MLSIDRLRAHIPDAVLDQIPDCAERFAINTPLRLAHFLAQCAHESAEFKVSVENLGLQGLAYETIQKQMQAPNGMVLNTGPTGSGKTTSFFT